MKSHDKDSSLHWCILGFLWSLFTQWSIFLHTIQKLYPLDIVSYYVITAQKLSTFLLSTSMQLSRALLFLNNYDVTKVKIKTAELWFSSFMWYENKQYCKKNYQWRLLKCKFMGTPFHVMESWATAGP